MRQNKPREYAEVTIDSIGFEGKAIGRVDGMVYFVDGAVAGDVVRAEIRKKKKNYVEAKVSEILVPSPLRTTPVCRYFGVCGGCKWQDLAYSEQIAWKKRNVQDAFERLGKIPFGKLHDTLPCESQFYYRNKMEFSFGDSRWLTDAEIQSGEEIRRDFALGLHVPARFDKVLDVEECFLQSQTSSMIVNSVRQAALEFGTQVYQTRSHEGFLRNLVIRNSRASGEIMVILVTSPLASDADTQFLHWFTAELPSLFREVATTIHAITTAKNTVAGGEPHILSGSGFITETILGVNFRISPFSFFQTNTNQAENLFSIALKYADIQPNQIVWDLYCGTGSISLCAAQKAKEVIGLELVESSILDARHNAELNGIENVSFFVENIEKAVASEIFTRLPKPDVIIIDPPRAGLHPAVAQKLPEFGAPVIVYVSCNPATQARDCALLSEFYDVVELQPVDMFPNTYHIETVAKLVRK